MQKRDSIIRVIIIILFAIFLIYFCLQGFEKKLTGKDVSSTLGNLSAQVSSYVSCTWSDAALNVSFGTELNPGDSDVNATRNNDQPDNGTSYNVTIDEFTNELVNITIKGDHLVSGVNIIEIGNISWASNATSSNGINMASENSHITLTDYDNLTKIASNAAIGSSAWYRFWVDLPPSQVAGSYIGNYTMKCEAAT